MFGLGRFEPRVVGALLCVSAMAFIVPRAAAEDVPEGLHPIAFTHDAMATRFSITFCEGSRDAADLQRIADEAFDTIDDLEQRISTWRADSQTADVNARAAREPVKVAPDVFRLIQTAQQLSADTQGAFDVTVKPLLELWGLYADQAAAPSADAIAQARDCVGSAHIDLNASGSTVRFDRAGMALDFGAIGKGAALDAAAAILKDYGIRCALLEGGTSTVVALGHPPGEPRGWPVRIADPAKGNASLGTVYLRDQSLSTSMIRARVLQAGGTAHGHIIDPRTGQCVDATVLAAAIAATGTESDGLSTAFIVLGVPGVQRYCAAHPDVAAAVMSAKASAPVWFNYDANRVEVEYE